MGTPVKTIFQTCNQIKALNIPYDEQDKKKCALPFN